MPNQLSLPFKKTWDIDVKSAVGSYLKDVMGTHPDAFRWDISRWKTLRKEAVGGVVRSDRIDVALNYHAQLLYIMAKFPTNIRLEFTYTSTFLPSDTPVKLEDLAFERAAVLFNLAALYSQLAEAEDRSNRDGLKRASDFYQSCAGTLSFLIFSATPKLSLGKTDKEMPWDLTEPFLKSLEWLMLAQAQECIWQRALSDNRKNGLIAKLAASVASLYRTSIQTIYDSTPSFKNKFPSGWLSHLEAKQYHFRAAAQLRKSMDELEYNRYGSELARLTLAQDDAKNAYKFARRSGVSTHVLQDAKSLLETVQRTYTRSQRDNDLIYHHEIPTASALDIIQETCMAKTTVPSGLTNPNSATGNEKALFADLIVWGAREAINIYADHKKNFVNELGATAHNLDCEANKVLLSLNLPSSLDALERPIGLPPSLLAKAETVRTDEGPTRIDASIEDVQRLAQQSEVILDEAMDILDNEASEDEVARNEGRIHRSPSHEANKELVEKGQKFRTILEKAAKSDEIVRRKWDDWETNIKELTWDEDRLTNSIPSSTIPSSASNSSQSHVHARKLRVLIHSLNEIKDSRDGIVKRAHRLAETDDIQSRILEAAARFEQSVEVEPVMFEDIEDEELAKYDKFSNDINQSKMQQDQIILDIRATHELFWKSRRDDPSVIEREHALQSLDLAYQKYREITHNLDEGLKFYNDFADVLSKFKDACEAWSTRRNREIHDLTHTFRSMSLNNEEEAIKASKKPTPSRPPPTTPGLTRVIAMTYPPTIDSNEWTTVDLPPGPRSHAKNSSKSSNMYRK